MFNNNISKIVAILALFIIGILSVWFIVLPFIAIGPGLPPPAGMPEWYIPGYDIKIENESIVKDRSVAEQFELIGNRIINKNLPYFPVISQYCGYANYSRTRSDDRYLVAAWYFEDSKKFLQAEEELLQYLEGHGRVSNMMVDISEEIKRSGKDERYKGEIMFDVTQYENEITSGYFLVYNNPFGIRDDYFIVYYGFVGSFNLSNQTVFLKELIADGYYVNEPGTVGNLNNPFK